MTEIETGLFESVTIYFYDAYSGLPYGGVNPPPPITIHDARVNYTRDDRFLHVVGATEEYSFHASDVKSIHYKNYKS